MTTTPPNRWEALDLLRGLSIIGMLLNLTPGAWDKEYTWMTHAKWQGGHLIDMVAPAFLFCIGAAMTMSFGRRAEKGAGKGHLAGHILWRTLLLVALGLFLNAYPAFDFAHMRIPGVLQKIGLAYGLTSLFVLLTAKQSADGKLVFSPVPIAGALVFVLISHWVLLYFVPVPGFGAPRFDPLGSWPAYIDRTVFTVPHMFIYWPVNGKVIFDPDGLVNVYTSGGNILLGALAGLAYEKQWFKRPMAVGFAAGVAMMIAAALLNGICPIIKNIWTSTFVLFSGGFSLVLLAILTLVTSQAKAAKLLSPVLYPLRVFGSNPLLAYLICFLFAPVLDINWIPHGGQAPVSLRYGSQLLLNGIDPSVASFLFGVTYLVLMGLILWVCYHRRWFLRL